VIPYFEPTVIHLGPIPLHSFGLLVATGFLIGGQLAMNRARRVGLDPDVINRLIGWLVLGTFVGGHLGYGLWYAPGEYFRHPIEFLKVWQGLSSFGGFAACVPITIWFFKSNKLPVWPYMDCVAYGLTVGWFLGRMGCTSVHDHPGTAGGHFPLAIYCRPVPGHIFHWPELMRPDHGRMAPWGPCAADPAVNTAHDMGFYEALWSLSMFGLFWLLDRRPRTPGIYPLLLGALYGPARFYMDFFRPSTTDARWFGLTAAQYGSVVLFLVCVFYLVRVIRRGKEPYWTVEGARRRAAEEPEAG